MKCQIHSRCSISLVFKHAGSYLDGFIVEKFAFVLLTVFMLSISQNPLPIFFFVSIFFYFKFYLKTNFFVVVDSLSFLFVLPFKSRRTF